MFNSQQYRCRPFPTESVRDLLGIARAAYRCHRDSDPSDRGRFHLLEQAGSELRNALRLGDHQPGSLGHSTAWKRAERGAEQLCQYVGEGGGLATVVRMAAQPLKLESRGNCTHG